MASGLGKTPEWDPSHIPRLLFFMALIQVPGEPLGAQTAESVKP